MRSNKVFTYIVLWLRCQNCIYLRSQKIYKIWEPDSHLFIKKKKVREDAMLFKL